MMDRWNPARSDREKALDEDGAAIRRVRQMNTAQMNRLWEPTCKYAIARHLYERCHQLSTKDRRFDYSVA